MAGKEVRAGKAFVEIALRDKLDAGLKRAATQLRAFATVTSAIGAGLVGASAGILGPLAAAVADFTRFGATMDDVAQRTGLSAAAVSELAHAANQSGTDVETLEKGIRKMQQTLVEAASGSADAKDSLAKLNLTVADLRGLSPDQQFAKLADGLAKLKDPSVRTAAAMGVFGKAGAQLLPMLAGGAAGLDKMREQARALGIAITNQDAKAAAALDDAFDVLTSTAKGLTRQIGAALAPVLTNLVDQLSETVASVTRFVRENRGLVTMTALGAVALGAAGAALLGLGGALQIASIGVGALAMVWGVAATAMFFVPKTLSRVARSVSAGMSGLVSSAQRTAGSWSATWKRASQSFSTWLADVATRSGTITAAFRPLISGTVAVGQRLGMSIASGIRSAAPAVGQAAMSIVSGLQRSVSAVPAVWNVVRQATAAFGRGFTGDISLFTTRANAVMWGFGSTVRSVFDRVAAYGRALQPLFAGVVSAIASRIAPVWETVSQRIIAATNSTTARISTAWQRTAAGLTATWQRTVTAVQSALRQVPAMSAAIWQRVRDAGTQAGSSLANTFSLIATGKISKAFVTIGAVASRVVPVWNSVSQRIVAVSAGATARISAAWKLMSSRLSLSDVVQRVANAGQRIAGGVTAAWERAVAAVGGTLRQLPAISASAWQRVRDAGIQAATALSNSFVRMASGNIRGVFSSIGAIARGVVPVWGGISQRLVALTNSATTTVVSAWQGVRPRIDATMSAIANRVAPVWQSVSQRIAAAASSTAATISAVWQSMTSRLSLEVVAQRVANAGQQIAASLAGTWQRTATSVGAALRQVPTMATATWQRIRDGGFQAATALTNTFTRMTGGKINGAFAAIGAVANRLVPAWNNVSQRIAAATNSVTASVASTWQGVSSRITGTMSAVGGTISSTWQSVGGLLSATTNSTWGSVATTIAQAAGRSMSAVESAYSSMTSFADQQWQRIAGAGQQVASRVSAIWQRLPAWVREPLSRVAAMAGEDAQRAVTAIGSAFRQVPALATAAWQRIRTIGTQAATTVATVTRSTMQRAFAVTRAAGVAAFNGVRRAGLGAMRSVMAASKSIPGKFGNAFSAVGGALTMLLPNAGGLLGTLLMGLPLVVTAVSAVGAALAGLLTPVGLVVAAVVGGIAAWTAWTSEGQQTLGALQQVFGALWSVAKKTFGGLSDALAAGDLKLAARVLWAGLKALWYTGAAELQKVWPTLQSAAQSVWQQISQAGASVATYLGQVWAQLPQWLTGPLGTVGQTVGTVLGWIGEQLGSLTSLVTETFSGIGTAIAQGDFSLAGEIAWTSIKLAFAEGIAWVTNTWTEFTTGLAMIWDGLVTTIREVWGNITSWIAKQILRLVGAIQSALDTLAKIDPSGLAKKLKEGLSFDVNAAIGFVEQDRQQFNRDQDQGRQQRDDQRVRDMQERIDASDKQLAELRAAREEALAKSRELAAAGGEKKESPLANAMAELEAAIADAGKARRLFDADKAAGDLAPAVDDVSVQSKQIAAAGTFNPFAIRGLGADSLAQRTAVAAEGINNKMGLLLKKAQDGVQFA